ncbi:hypothetical protein O0L34_g5639 [Tuta absoluta]|nr:hypothetical protein O0L34_g5639 [Tuta absoluta]
MRLVVPGCVTDARGIPALRVLVLMCAMGLYLSMGATVFQAIERPLEQALEDHVAETKRVFLRNHPCVSGKSSSSSTAEIHPLLHNYHILGIALPQADVNTSLE